MSDLSTLWINIQTIYQTRLVILKHRRELSSYKDTSYKGRQTIRDINHNLQILNNAIHKCEMPNYEKEYRNIVATLEKIQHSDALCEKLLTELVENILQHIHYIEQSNHHKFNFLSFRTSSPIDLNKEIIVTINSFSASVHYCFELMPFRWVDRRAIIDEILKDLER